MNTVTMRIATTEPPLFNEIDVKFNVRGKPVIYCFGDVIFNPMAVTITRELLHHEHVHQIQQGDHVMVWWALYLSDPVFRFEQEVPAHQVEYLAYCDNKANSRNMRRVIAKQLAKRLSSPLYGNLVSYEKALHLVKEQPDDRFIKEPTSTPSPSVPEKVLEA